MKPFLCVLLVSLFAFTIADAQNRPPARKPKGPTYGSWLSTNLSLSMPMNDYRASTGSIPFGLNVSWVYQPSVKTPLAIGLNLGFLSVGNKTIDRALTADITANGVLLDQLYIPLRFEIQNSIFQAHLNGRFIAPTNTVKPYIDGLAGLNYLWTSTSVYDRSEQRYFQTNDDGLITKKTQEDDITYSVGAGGGLMIQLGRKTHLNIGAHYLFGGTAQYYDRSQIEEWDIQLNVSGVGQGSGQGTFEPGDLTYGAVPKRSRTDMLMMQAGLTFNLAR
jgi:hypothetical protein